MRCCFGERAVTRDSNWEAGLRVTAQLRRRQTRRAQKQEAQGLRTASQTRSWSTSTSGRSRRRSCSTLRTRYVRLEDRTGPLADAGLCVTAGCRPRLSPVES